MFNSILLATDGSEYALRAAEKAIEIAKANPQAVITIVYVFDISKAKSAVLENWNISSTLDQRKKRVRSTEELFESSSIPYKTVFLHGVPGPEIVKYANENAIDLVIVGSRGKNKLQEFILGSVSHKVAKRVHCPVLIVKMQNYRKNVNASIYDIGIAQRHK